MVEPYTPAIDEMLMMAPPEGWSIICLPAHLQPKKVPLRLMPTTVFQPLAEMSSTLARKDAPALLIMTSRRPISFTVRSTSALTWSSCRTSTATQNERRPSLAISAVTGSRFSSLRLAITTSAPARANSSAMDLPMPTPPPVTMATLSSIENGDAAMAPPGVRGGSPRPRGLYPVGGRRALEHDRRAGDRMDEAEPRRVQAEAACGAERPAVGHVAHDRPARFRELHPDLVATPGPEAQLEQAALAAGGEDTVVGDRDAPALGGAHPEHPVLREPALERALLAGGSALDQRPVDALHAAGLELGLERPLHGLGLGEHEQARRLAIEPVDDEGAGLLRPMLCHEVVPEQAIGGALPLALGGDGEQARGLDHDQDRVVLVHEGEPARERRARPPAQRDDRARRDREAAVAAGAPVDRHPSGLEPLLEAPARGLRVERAQPLGERHSLRSTPSGRRPSRRRVPRTPTSRASPVAASTPAARVPGAHCHGTSKAQRSTAQASPAASALPATPAAAPSSAYSTANTRDTKPRVAPSAFRITDW